MGGPGRHIKSRRDKDHFCPVLGHEPGCLGKTEIIAHAQADAAEFSVKTTDLVPGRQGIRLSEVLTTRDLDIKHMGLAVFADLPAVPAEYISGVVDEVCLSRRLSRFHLFRRF